MLARKALRTSTCTESALREASCRSRSHWCPRSGRAMITSVLIIALVAIALAYDIYVTVFDLCQRTVAPLPDDVDFTVYAKQEQDDGVEVIAWLAAQPWCTSVARIAEGAIPSIPGQELAGVALFSIVAICAHCRRPVAGYSDRARLSKLPFQFGTGFTDATSALS
jgi:X-Pro dipeptidyl-peptidase (S15 family)